MLSEKIESFNIDNALFMSKCRILFMGLLRSCWYM